MSKPVLIVMAKAPFMGLGKTRLAKGIGRTQAWRVNCALQARTRLATHDPRWRRFWACAPDGAIRLHLPKAWPDRNTRIKQGLGGLGERLGRLAGPHARVAFVGVDAPMLTPAAIWEAFAALRRADVALGPTPDGGFWIIALRSGRAMKTLTRAVRWSSERTLSDVLANCAQAGLRWRLIRNLRDMDERDDFVALRRKARL